MFDFEDEYVKYLWEHETEGEGLRDFGLHMAGKHPLCKFGIVADNKDPACLGRVRVASEMLGPGAVTPWIQMIAIGAGKNRGWWQLPDIGTQVLMGFVGEGSGNPVVLGCIYDEKHPPPNHPTKKRADSVVYQTKKHRMEFIDEEGRESLIISSAKGQMRLVLEKGKGIKLVNELGDIKIKCRKLRIEGGDVNLNGRKNVRLTANRASVKAGGNMKLESGGQVNLKANNLKIDASRGITSGGRQLAKSDDKVMGFDIHQMVVPAGLGTAVVPLPHPFIGKITDRISDDVKINGYQAATEGSVATHDDQMHMQLPGTINFQQPPSKDGEVTGNVAQKLTINGKAAALIGSTVSTCNDMGMRDNSAILALGASFPMPNIIHPKNAEAWREERRARQKLHPEFAELRNSTANAKEGEPVTVIVRVKDIANGNPVTLLLFRRGQDPAVHIPLLQRTAVVKDGAAQFRWSYNHPRDMDFPSDDPGFFAVAYSAWCPPIRGEVVEIALKRPRLSDYEWADAEDKGTGEGLVNVALKMRVTCNADTKEGAAVIFRVYPEGADPKRARPVAERQGGNEGGTAAAEWAYEYRHDPRNPLKEKPKFFFTANSHRCDEGRSGLVEISQRINITARNVAGQEAKIDTPYELFRNGEPVEIFTTGDDGKITLDDMIPGNYSVMPKTQEENDDGK